MKKIALLIVVVVALAGCKTVDKQTVDCSPKGFKYVHIPEVGISLALTEEWVDMETATKSDSQPVRYFWIDGKHKRTDDAFPGIIVHRAEKKYWGEVIEKSRNDPYFFVENVIEPAHKEHGFEVHGAKYVQEKNGVMTWTTVYLPDENIVAQAVDFSSVSSVSGFSISFIFNKDTPETYQRQFIEIIERTKIH
jgi:hypothetical protein